MWYLSLTAALGLGGGNTAQSLRSSVLFGCKSSKATEANSGLCLGCAPGGRAGAPDGNDPPNIPFQNTVLILSIPTSVSVLIQGHPGQFLARKQMLSTKCTYLKTFQPKPSSEQSSYSFTVHFYYFFPSFIVGQFSLGTKLKSWLILQGGAVRT